MRQTGAAKSSTSAHSFADSGTIEKMAASAGTYRITQCSPNESAIAASSQGLLQGGICSSELSCARRRAAHGRRAGPRRPAADKERGAAGVRVTAPGCILAATDEENTG